MKATRLTKQLNIQAPIIQAGMPWVSNAELAATVCNSGGLGMITPNAGLQKDGDEIENYQTQLRKMKALTSRTYGVCLFMDHPLLDILVSITTEQAVPIVVTAGNGASDHTGHLKDAGITVFHVIGSVHQARSAEARGADGVIATGLEAAGPGSTDRLSLFTLVPQVVDAIEIPVIAAGGISDGRGLAAAIGLGASAAYIGTRFVATHECVAHPNFKDAIINAVDTSTAIVNVNSCPTRLLRNRAFEHLRNSSNGTDPGPSYSNELTRALLLEGAMEEGLVHCGAGAGVVNEVLSAAEVVKALISGADTAMSRIR